MGDQMSDARVHSLDSPIHWLADTGRSHFTSLSLNFLIWKIRVITD